MTRDLVLIWVPAKQKAFLSSRDTKGGLVELTADERGWATDDAPTLQHALGHALLAGFRVTHRVIFEEGKAIAPFAVSCFPYGRRGCRPS